jgi:hypothetical protein
VIHIAQTQYKSVEDLQRVERDIASEGADTDPHRWLSQKGVDQQALTQYTSQTPLVEDDPQVAFARGTAFGMKIAEEQMGQ